jgi:hypothetical protein
MNRFNNDISVISIDPSSSAVHFNSSESYQTEQAEVLVKMIHSKKCK